MSKEWKIDVSRYEECFIKTDGEDGSPQYFLVGYERGRQAMKKDHYYPQRIKDHAGDVVFYPEPAYLSYSFFLGYFEEAVRILESLRKKNDTDDIPYTISEFKKLFGGKFRFMFRNARLGEQVKGFVNSLYTDVYLSGRGEL